MVVCAITSKSVAGLFPDECPRKQIDHSEDTGINLRHSGTGRGPCNTYSDFDAQAPEKWSRRRTELFQSRKCAPGYRRSRGRTTSHRWKLREVAALDNRQ